MNENYLTPESSLLGDLDIAERYPPVDKGTRFGNLFLDGIILSMITWSINKALLMMGIVLNPPAAAVTAINMAYLQMLMLMYVRAAMITAVFSVIYYTITETVFKGQSIGKLITGTQAVNTENYAPVTFSQALVRSLCRQIPLATIAALFVQPWHDTLSKTTVIAKKKRNN